MTVRLPLFVLSFILCLTATGQTIIKGKITAADDGLPIPNADITVLGQDSLYNSNMEGEFEVYANVGDTLIFSFIGYVERHWPIKDNGLQEVELRPFTIEDDFGQNRIHFYLGRETISGMFGGKLKYVSQFIGGVSLQPSISYYSRENASFTEAEFGIFGLIYAPQY